jgi:ABC-type multidrug transport system permease subunit
VTTLARLSGRPASGGGTGSLGLLRDQLGHAAQGLWRSRVVLVFTFVLPLVWLLLIGLIAGNEVVDPVTGVRTMQFVTPMAAVLGIVFAAYPPVATALALAREQQVLKRLRGTPLPTWIYLLGQVGASLALAGVALVVMLGIGVAAYGVEIQWRSALASVVTVGLGIACLASIGLAVGALAPSAQTAQAFAMASAVVMGFVSGLFRVGTTQEPAWMVQVGGLFPMRNIGDPLRDQFDPFGAGSGWEPGALAVLLAWGIGALLVAAWALRREPASSSAPGSIEARRAAAHSAGARAVGAPTASLRATVSGRPSAAGLVADQARAAIRAASRNPSIVFFAIIMPVGLYALICSMYPGTDVLVHGMPIGVWFAAAMTVYGAGVIGFMYLPTNLATARDRLALKRLRGTPLPAWIFLAGQAIQVLILAALVGILMLVVGWAGFGVRVAVDALPAAILVLAVGTLALAACGFAIAAFVPTARASSVLTMAILLPLSFISDVFVAGNIPEPIPTFASVFPLKHAVAAFAATLNPVGVSFAWGDLAVVVAWFLGASIVAIWGFRWEPAPESAAAALAAMASPGTPRRRRGLRRLIWRLSSRPKTRKNGSS